MPVHFDDDARSRAVEMSRFILATGRQFVVFLNARETPASNFAGPDERRAKHDEKLANGWLDASHPPTTGDVASQEPSASTGSFLRLLHELTGTKCPHLTIVLVCRDSQQSRESGLLKALADQGVRQRLSGR